MFFNGDTLPDAMTLLATVRFYRRDVLRTSQLTRATSALAGFKKLDPPQGRLPVPWPMMCAICRFLWRSDRPTALWLLVVWALCCRPGEALKLRKMDMTPPTTMCPHWIMVLHADPEPVGAVLINVTHEQKKTSKVGVMDEAVIVDQPYMGKLGKILKTFCQHKTEVEKIFGSTRTMPQKPSCGQ